eukprot:FR743729.1.p1 GENE.FR743729.1~~FR743729.1.p1  ORF type:complete len:183 (+),score=2.86 FR743729.1:135-683(+)
MAKIDLFYWKPFQFGVIMIVVAALTKGCYLEARHPDATHLPFMDEDKSGGLDLNELQQAMSKSLGRAPTHRELAQAILLGDQDNSNDISQHELARVHATHTALGVQRALSFCQTVSLILLKEITLALAGAVIGASTVIILPMSTLGIAFGMAQLFYCLFGALAGAILGALFRLVALLEPTTY